MADVSVAWTEMQLVDLKDAQMAGWLAELLVFLKAERLVAEMVLHWVDRLGCWMAAVSAVHSESLSVEGWVVLTASMWGEKLDLMLVEHLEASTEKPSECMWAEMKVVVTVGLKGYLLVDQSVL